MVHLNTKSVRSSSRPRIVTTFEAVVVLGIVSLVAACLFPIVAQARESAKNASHFTRYRVSCLANSLYAADYDGDDDLIPTGVHGRRELNNSNGKAKPGGGGGTGIFYHGGPLMLATVNVYYIWYGNWTFDNTTNNPTNILTDLASNIGGSPYYNINTTYYDGAGNHVFNGIHYAGSTTDSYSQGHTNLSDSAIQAVVASAISSGRLPKDTNGVYFVLTSVDVTKSGFCTSYCGWHTHGTLSGSDIKYSFVGNAAQCPSGCAAQTTSPNGNTGADAMASIIAHELEEATSDPDLNAWFDRRGYENADKCAWTFGTTSTASNGSKYNMTVGTRNYLIQRNWVNAGGGGCALSYP